MPGFDVSLYEPIPLLREFLGDVAFNVLVVSSCQVQVELRHNDVEWVSHTDDGFVDRDRIRSAELDWEVGLNEPCLVILVVPLTFESHNSKGEVDCYLIAVGSASRNTCNALEVLAEKGRTRTHE